MNELFEIPECKSPRLLWIHNHELKSEWVDESLINKGEWFAWSLKQGFDLLDALENGDGCIGEGSTEDDAIVDWAKKTNVKLWNEEPILCACECNREVKPGRKFFERACANKINGETRRELHIKKHRAWQEKCGKGRAVETDRFSTSGGHRE